jgi:hypothetical protein
MFPVDASEAPFSTIFGVSDPFSPNYFWIFWACFEIENARIAWPKMVTLQSIIYNNVELCI